MKQSRIRIIFFSVLIIATAFALLLFIQRQIPRKLPIVSVGDIDINYPIDGTIFPPEFPAPTWIWHDTINNVSFWKINFTFCDDSFSVQIHSSGEQMKIGIIDQSCVSSSNKLPELSEEQKSAHTWTPNSVTWENIKIHSANKPVTVVITGHVKNDSTAIVSNGRTTIQISSDSVGAPVFYRDVPLMPSENEKGVIKPLAKEAIPLISWKIRNIGDNSSKILMDNIHTCANCHSFSTDGKIMGIDMDGPRNDKGLFAIVNIKSIVSICNQDLISWSSFRGKLGSTLRVGFMSQISPNGQFVITTVHDPGINQTEYERHRDPIDLTQSYYVANFRDYRFLQVFYPTRGVLAWYDHNEKKFSTLPGADNTTFVHTNAV
jgi:hypothetical protein